MNRIVLCFLVGVLMISCADDKKAPAKESPSEYQPKKGLEAEPAIQKTDSLQILFYDDPDGDSLRYARFYSYTTSKDSVVINALLKDLDKPFEQLNQVKKCRSEGKLYLFAEKEPLKTIYFSTRCDSCCYLYFIKDGAFLYFPLSKELNAILNEQKPQAKTE